MFTSKLNTMTGKIDWEIVDENYDFHQELARAGFADMLHDYERNRKYYEGLKKVIGKLKAENKHVHVLDIGTGTGLLSMMAVRYGADKVTACEGFAPMIDVALKCMESNGMRDKIQLIKKRSTEIQMGVDMSEKANVLVTEVFDTELIGEGAIETYSHALENLLTKDCYVVPDNAVMYVQCVESIECFKWNCLNLDEFGLNVHQDYANLAGDSIFDIQLTQFKEFKPLTPPLVAFKFSFSGKEPLLFDNQAIIDTVALTNGKTHAFFVWWEIRMDFENDNILSCAPVWAHPTPNNMQWRDHWMQAIYFPSQVLTLQKNEQFKIKCNHDEYSLWFDVSTTNNSDSISLLKERSLGITLISRNRLSQLNDSNRNKMFIKMMKNHEGPGKNLLIVNDDFSVLPLLAAKFTNFNKIVTLETNKFREKYLNKLLADNNLDNRVKIINKSFHELSAEDLVDYRFDFILSEFSFNQALLPWDNLIFYYGYEHFESIFSSKPNCARPQTLPFRIRFNVIAVNMENLDKIRSPVGSTEGFDITEFDRVIMEASKKTDGFIEPHPLWEYPCYPLSDVHEIFNLEFQNRPSFSEVVETRTKIELINEGTLNGIAIWYAIDYDENDAELVIDTGLIQKPVKNDKLEWSRFYKQAVHIMETKVIVDGTNRSGLSLNCFTKFEPNLGKFNIYFKVE